jgi:hypothetical protein
MVKCSHLGVGQALIAEGRTLHMCCISQVLFIHVRLQQCEVTKEYVTAFHYSFIP